MPKVPKKKAPPKKSPAKKVAKNPPKSFMWKLLERKKIERKRLEKNQNTSTHPFAEGDGKPGISPREQSFTRFNGPRRRAV